MNLTCKCGSKIKDEDLVDWEDPMCHKCSQALAEELEDIETRSYENALWQHLDGEVDFDE